MKLIRSYKSRLVEAGFTMIELVICLGIISFALIAIIGVLPVGINVQKDNREETIIVQDGMYWMEAIRSGATGLDNLTNHVEYIRIDETSNRAGYRWEPVSVSPGDNHLFLPGGAAIIGLLSMPVQADLVGRYRLKIGRKLIPGLESIIIFVRRFVQLLVAQWTKRSLLVTWRFHTE